MSGFSISPDAARDIREIRDEIQRHRPGRTESYLDDLKRTFKLLGDMPYIGRARPDIRFGLRSFGYAPYIVIYRPTRRRVEIVRVVHGRRDLGRIFDAE